MDLVKIVLMIMSHGGYLNYEYLPIEAVSIWPRTSNRLLFVIPCLTPLRSNVLLPSNSRYCHVWLTKHRQTAIGLCQRHYLTFLYERLVILRHFTADTSTPTSVSFTDECKFPSVNRELNCWPVSRQSDVCWEETNNMFRSVAPSYSDIGRR